MEHIRPGDIIQGPYWPEPVELNLVEAMGPYVRIVGRTTISRRHVDQVISRTEIQNFQVSTVAADFKASPHKVFLILEALRYRYASLYDPLLAMNISNPSLTLKSHNV